jgi:hypothetical protein
MEVAKMLDEKADMLCDLHECIFDSIYHKSSSEILQVLSTEMGIYEFDNDFLATLIFDFAFTHKWGTKTEYSLIKIDGKDFAPKDFSELYDLLILIVNIFKKTAT